MAAIPNDGPSASIALGATDVYIGTASSIWSIPKTGGLLRTLVSGGAAARAIEVDGTNVYWAAGTSIKSVPIGGGQPVVRATTQESADSLVVDSSGIYWVEGNRTIKSIALTEDP